MEEYLRKISGFLAFVLTFVFSAYLYFTAKGFVYENGTLVLKTQTAHAEDIKKGIAVVLPNNININASNKYAVGPANAPLTMYEYSSLGCPHCADFHLSSVPKLEKEFVSQGVLRIVFVNFPLDKKSMEGAMLSQCMTYENYHDFITRLFDRQRFWLLAGDDTPLLKYAAEYGLSYDEAEACKNDNALASSIIADRQQAISQLKMEGTPAFLISGADGNEIIYGQPRYSDLVNYIRSRLQRLGYVME